jgi:tetratricopeptide (TPR) repeat protein
MSVSYSHGREFVSQVRPFFEARDAEALVRHLQMYWPHEQLRELCSCGHTDAAKVAATCLALTGTMEDNPVLAALLRTEDSTTVALAEHAMWSIWFRPSDARAGALMDEAVRLISQNELDTALSFLNELIRQKTNFAEAYNQRAIVYFLKESYHESLVDCFRTLRLNPFHFGALAGVGHCQASLGCLDLALEAYHRALQIHPHMDGIRQSIREIRRKSGEGALAASSSRPRSARR